MKQTTILNLSETEVTELTERVDLGRVWDTTVQRIRRGESDQRPGDAPAGDAGLSTRAGRRFSRRIRCLMAAAALILCFGGAVFAVQKGYFEAFFGIEPVADSQILRVNESQSSDGVRMTLAEVIPGETDGVITVAFEREDGRPFPENVQLARFDVLLDGKGVNMSSGKRLSDDGKQLLYCIELDGGETITGKTLTLEAGTVYSVDTRETRYDSINLKEMYDLCPVNLSAGDMKEIAGVVDGGAEMSNKQFSDRIYRELARQMKGQNASLDADGRYDTEYPGVHLAGIGLLTDNLCVGLEIPGVDLRQDLTQSRRKEQRALRDEASVTDLLDRRTNKKILWSRSSQCASEDGQTVVFTTFERDAFTEEDLAFLTPVITYEHKELISQGQWTLSYTFSESLTKNLKTDIVRSLTEGDIQITDARISVMGVSLYARRLDYVEDVSSYTRLAPYQPEVRVILRDGSELELTWVQSSVAGGTGGRVKYKYILENRNGEDQERRFIDQELLDSIANLSVDGTLIPMN